MERVRMELIAKLTNELDAEISRVWSDYIDLFKELDIHRVKPIDETNLEEVNRILKEIQDTFAAMHPAFHFIAVRHQSVENAVVSYNDFIETLKKSGAMQDEPTS